MVANLCFFLTAIFLDFICLENGAKVFYAKDRYIEEFIFLYADDTTGVSINLFKDHGWYVESDFKYFFSGDTLRIDFVDDKTENGVLLVRRNKLKKLSFGSSLYFNKYHRLSIKKLLRIIPQEISSELTHRNIF